MQNVECIAPRLTWDEVKTLAEHCVYEYYGDIGPDVDEILVKMGYESGMSEDTYYEMTEK